MPTKQSGLDIAAARVEECRINSSAGLNLSGLGLSMLPPQIGMLNSLKALRLDHNNLITLPPTFRGLTSLQHLSLADNCIRHLPEQLRELKELWDVDLSSNGLTTLPTHITALRKLTRLDLSSNRLEGLPSEISKLSSLTSLDLTSNALKSLPKELFALPDLQTLYLHQNPQLGIPIELLGPARDEHYRSPKHAKEILLSYSRIAGEAGSTLGECKIIVVGRGQAGKTSLVKRLRGEHYDPNEPETHGITIQKLTLNGRHGKVKGRVWDFGGQVVLHSMHEFFLTARSLYLLVLGERDDMLERDAAYWLQLIRSYAGDAPVIVALNKSAGRQRQFDRGTLEKDYGPILGWVPTECSVTEDHASGIVDLHEAIIRALDSSSMESVRRKFPKKWHDIKAELEGMTESYLDYPEYVLRCINHDEREPLEQAALASDLHDLGVALNYSRDPRLRDTTVLRPDWLANGIYAVLRANDLDDALPSEFNSRLAVDGVITLESLKQIHLKAEAWKMLRAADYPADKRKFLLRLMDAFHLSYPLDDEGRQQLVPALLPLEPPPKSDEPSGANRVRLRYEFQVVPSPLLPWFIARTFALIPNRLHWRRGAILEFGKARAKVWATQDERYVFATVGGGKQDRKRLIAMIRGTLHRIFKEYKALHPTEQWEHHGSWVPRGTLEQFGVLPTETHGSIEPSESQLEVKP